MSNSFHPWLHRFALLLSVSTLALIGVGGLVTSHGVGMAVPDWPNTYGYNMFLFPVSQWVGGILYEHSHRLVASAVGLLTSILAVWLWVRETRGRGRWLGVGAIVLVLVLMGVRQLPVYIALACLAPLVIGWCFYRASKDQPALRWWGIMALAAVILQGVLGGLRVVLFKDELGILHAGLAQLFFVLVCAIALFTSRVWPQIRVLDSNRSATRLLRRLTLGATLLILAQLVLGASMRHQHAGLAIPDFPLAYGQLWPAMDSAAVTRYNQQRLELVAANPITAMQIMLQMVHRLLAILITAAVAACAWTTWRRLGGRHALTRLSAFWLGLIALQVVLGAATIWSNKAADIATAHVLVGAISLATGAVLSILCIQGLVLAQKRETIPDLPPAWSINSTDSRLQPGSTHS
jgi:cytochrome c oxidase assembly protein subunit 15